MSEPFIAEVKIWACNFAPRGWAFCDGQELPIAQNTALFSLIGTIYGGNGRTTTGLPDIQGRAVMHPGEGPGLTPYRLGHHGGAETVTLTSNEIPSHTHSVNAQDDNNPTGNSLSPAGNYIAKGGFTNQSGQTMAANMVSSTGGGQEHNNMQPYQVLNFCIALQGLFPSRS